MKNKELLFSITPRGNGRFTIRSSYYRLLGDEVCGRIGESKKKEVSFTLAGTSEKATAIAIEATRIFRRVREVTEKLSSLDADSESFTSIFDFAVVYCKTGIHDLEELKDSEFRAVFKQKAVTALKQAISEEAEEVVSIRDIEVKTAISTFGDLIRGYFASERDSGEIAHVTVKQNYGHVNKLLDVLDENTPLEHLCKKTIRTIMGKLKVYPARKEAYHGDIPFEIIVATEAGRYTAINETTYSYVLSFLRRALGWGYDEGHMSVDLRKACSEKSKSRNGVHKSKGAFTIPESEIDTASTFLSQSKKVKPFDSEMLDAIYRTHFFRSKRRRGHIARYGYYPLHFWLYPICQFTGMRSREVAQLSIDDVVCVGSIWCLVVNDAKFYQRVKSVNGRRIIPVHNMLLELGLLDYVEWRKNLKGVPEIYDPLLMTPVVDKFIFSNAGKNLDVSRAIRKEADIPYGRQYTCHSFRHLFVDVIRSKNIPEWKIAQIVGHDGRTSGEVALTTTKYGHRALSVAELQKVVNLYESPVDVSFLNWERFRDNLLQDWKEYRHVR